MHSKHMIKIFLSFALVAGLMPAALAFANTNPLDEELLLDDEIILSSDIDDEADGEEESSGEMIIPSSPNSSSSSSSSASSSSASANSSNSTMAPAKDADKTVAASKPSLTLAEIMKALETSAKTAQLAQIPVVEDKNISSLPAGEVKYNEGDSADFIDRIEVPEALADLYGILEEATDGDGEKDYLIEDRYFKVGNIAGAAGAQVGGLYTISTNSKYENNAILVSKFKYSEKQQISNMMAQAKAIYLAFERDHSDAFWIDRFFTFVAKTSGNTAYLYLVTASNDPSHYKDIRIPQFRSQKAIEEEREAVEKSTEAMLAGIPEDQAEAIVYLNNWLVENADYGNLEIDSVWPAHRMNSAIHGRSGDEGPVCEGYARALRYLCEKLDIPCTTVVGYYGSAKHMWNEIKIGDLWYIQDTTCNDLFKENRGTNAFTLIGADNPLFGNYTVEDAVYPAVSEVSYGVLPAAADDSAAVADEAEAVSEEAAPEAEPVEEVRVVAVTADPSQSRIVAVSPSKSENPAKTESETEATSEDAAASAAMQQKAESAAIGASKSKAASETASEPRSIVAGTTGSGPSIDTTMLGLVEDSSDSDDEASGILSHSATSFYVSPLSIVNANIANGKLTVSWPWDRNASGYQIKFTVGSTVKTITVEGAFTTSKVIAGVTGEKVSNVQVRPYKTMGFMNVYSAWSLAAKLNA